jgi:hypothetical protein
MNPLSTAVGGTILGRARLQSVRENPSRVPLNSYTTVEERRFQRRVKRPN